MISNLSKFSVRGNSTLQETPAKPNVLTDEADDLDETEPIIVQEVEEDKLIQQQPKQID